MAHGAVAAVKELIGEARYFDETVTPDKIRLLLDNVESSTTSKAGINEKVDGMKYLLAMMARGRDVSAFFPDVVRNVVVKSVEVKKLVYSYLVANADANVTCRDLALLAINSFQRDLSDSNQLIRALALRVLCGIRVREIVQIQLMAVKKCCTDSSAYVRKSAAHSVGKVLLIDPEARGELVEIVTRLLGDRAPPVLSSAVAAFEEVCPDRLDLLHPHYRKLCILLSDLDEWGQVAALGLLTRYARTAFTDPNPPSAPATVVAEAEGKASKKKAKSSPAKAKKGGFYSSEEDSSDSSDSDSEGEGSPSLPPLPEDHALLLRCALPLLRSRNTAVVLAVAGVYHHAGRKDRETGERVGRALVRAMRGHRETQYLLLGSIIELARTSPEMFRRYLKDFYALEGEPAFVRSCKLQVLTALIAPDNASLILREFTRYVKDDDKEFVKAAIKALVNMANALPSIADRCLRGLMALVGTDCAAVVAEAVVAIRQLLQQHPEHDGIVLRLIKRLPSTTIPSARAAIIWVAGEFQSNPRLQPLAPDLLRLLAKGFKSEATEVKLQVLTFAAKTALQQGDLPAVNALFQYVLELARYDQDYDLRDRARLLRHLLLRSGDISALAVDAAEEAGAVIAPRRGPAESDVLAGDADALASALAALEGPSTSAVAGGGGAGGDASIDLLLAPPSPVAAPRSGVLSLALSPGVAASGAASAAATPARLKERVTAVLLAAKPPPSVAAALEAAEAGSGGLRVGSLSGVLGHAARGYVALPPWAEVASSPKLRDPPREEPPVVAASSAKRASGGGGAGRRASTSSEDSDTSSSSSSSSDSDSEEEDDTDSTDSDSEDTSSESDSEASDDDSSDDDSSSEASDTD